MASQFRGFPGYEKVLKGEFHLLHDRKEGSILDKSRWSTSVLPGMRILMSIIVDGNLCMQKGSCPRRGCQARNVLVKGQQRITWYASLGYQPSRLMLTKTSSECGMTYYSNVYKVLQPPSNIGLEIFELRLPTVLTDPRIYLRYSQWASQLTFVPKHEVQTRPERLEQDDIKDFKRIHISADRLSSVTLYTLYSDVISGTIHVSSS